MDRRQKLEMAASAVALVIAELDITGTRCESCGTRRYNQFEEKQMATELDGIRRKLLKLAGKLDY